MAEIKIFKQMMNRALLAAGLGKQFGGVRDLYNVFGYKTALTFDDFWNKYHRQDIAARIVDSAPQATWRIAPAVTAEGSPAFEEDFQRMAKRLSLWSVIERADKLAGIGEFSVILIGTAGTDFSQPMRPLSSVDDILYLEPVSQRDICITEFERDPSNERFNMPKFYSLQTGGTGEAIPSRTFRVHWSHVIHIAEGILDNTVFGQPRLQRIFNRLDDLEKVIGGSAEVFWLNARNGLHVQLDPEAELDPQDEKNLSDEINEFQHQLRRVVRTRGVKIDNIGGLIPDPRGNFQVLISTIAGATGIPQRILLGSERGQLASGQDERAWFERIRERQNIFAGPRVVRPLIERLQQQGALPDTEYHIEFPTFVQLSETDMAEISRKLARAVRDYGELILKGGEPIIPPEEFRERFLGLSATPAMGDTPSVPEPEPEPPPGDISDN